ncbi:MAG: hypothetical protein E7191_07720, partial [Erysipelotrichaceae bacterium]|nr:hypothetical protein [Erysipelotrichaceae bacterium]
MKKLLAVLLAVVMVVALTGCGNKDNDTDPNNNNDDPNITEVKDQNDPVDVVDMNTFLGTKTGKFYSQFTGGKMYMEYEMEMEGIVMNVISATDGDKMYSESKMNGMSTGVTIVDGEDMYVVDHTSKMVIKMSNAMEQAAMAGTSVIEEDDVDMGDLVRGSREIEGKKYDSEEWIVEGTSAVMCFDGND